MNKENTISDTALKSLGRLIQDILDDRSTVVAVSQLVLSGTLRAGLKVSPPAAQVISILLLTLGRACIEQLSGVTNRREELEEHLRRLRPYTGDISSSTPLEQELLRCNR